MFIILFEVETILKTFFSMIVTSQCVAITEMGDLLFKHTCKANNVSISYRMRGNLHLRQNGRFSARKTQMFAAENLRPKLLHAEAVSL